MLDQNTARHRRSRSSDTAPVAAAVAALFHGSQLGACACSGDGSAAGDRQANHHILFADDRPSRGRQLCQLSSDSQPRLLELPCCRQATVGPCCRAARARRPCRDRHGRHHRTSMGAADHGTRNLPRPGPLQPRPFRQSQRTALVELHGAHASVMDQAYQGSTGPDVARPFGAIEPRARPPTQAADRLGPARRFATVSLVAGSSDHLHWRQQFRCP